MMKKVNDKNGTPLIFAHRTDGTFEVFVQDLLREPVFILSLENAIALKKELDVFISKETRKGQKGD